MLSALEKWSQDSSFSLVPLRLTGYLGLAIMAVTIPMLILMVLANWFVGANITPIAFFTVFNTLLIGVVLCALGCLMTDQVGIMNIGVDGMMLMGAFFAVLGSYFAGSWVAGVACALATSPRR